MDDVEFDHYQHSPLTEPDGLRIIVLHPSPSITSPITCDLIHSTLHHYDDSIIDHYTALSYDLEYPIWGSATDKRTILVNGKPLSITATLDSALRHIRDPKQEVQVWADGICINQHNVDDKNHQVRMMGLIYEIARHTVIYLGEATTETDTLFEKLTTHIPTSGRSGFLANVRYSSENAYFDGQRSGGVPADLPYLQSLARNHVLNRPWFTRVWILQELVLSGDPWVQIGTHRLRWIAFTELMLRGIDHPDLLPSEEGLVRRRLVDMQALHLALEAGHGVFDPRDMLHAHLGMVERDERKKFTSLPIVDPLYMRGKEKRDSLIHIDYNKSVPKIYTDLALYLLRCQRGFGFLSHVEDIALEERDPRLPSWVPDWTIAQTSVDARSHFTEHFEMPGFDLAHIVLGEQTVLGCIGDFVGIIEVVIDDFPPMSEIEMICQKIKDITFSVEGSEPATYSDYSDDEGIAASSSNGSDDDSQPTNEQLVQVGDDFLPVLKDIEDLPPRFLQHVVPYLRRRIRMIMREPDIQHLSPEEPYTAWWRYVRWYEKDDENDDSDFEEGTLAPSQRERLIGQVLLALTDYHSSSFFAGKKLAIIKPWQISLVPRWAKAGDFICKFNDNRSLPYAVRKIEPSKISLALDEEMIRFFTDNKVAAREKYVEYSKEGEIIWKKDSLDDQKILNLGILINVWPEYLNESAELHAEGRQHWWNHFYEYGEDNYQLDPELKRKLDELSSKVIQTTNIASEEEVLLQQTDTSEVGHFHLIGECIIDEKSTFRELEGDGDFQPQKYKDKKKQHIIALH
ncbi:hypothetical protein BDZ45DRAFT_800611 [Acephala macrosclerotiorum]|nr:hypothetical protein BDZ45DRAFT_800611 [Acephala macrosclerotiorum]